MGLFNKNEDENLKNGKKYLKETMGTNLYANSQYFSELRKRNVKTRKNWAVWKEVHSQILNELENKELEAEKVPERCYQLTEKVIQNNKENYLSDNPMKKEVIETLPETKPQELKNKNDELKSKIENKFNIDLTGKYWFKCTIEELKASTFTNTEKRNIDYCYVIVEDTYLDLYKESVWIKTNMGNRRIFYENIASIDYDARGKFHASNSLFLNLKSSDRIQ